MKKTKPGKTEFLELKRKLFDKYYSKLNDMQRKAVFCVNGPLLVLAGAGSGKTTVLVNRISNIISCGNAYESDELPDNSEELYSQMLSLEESGTREQIGAFLPQLAVKPAKPYKVLCITFTNKAASEFKDRLHSLLGQAADDIWAGTFHSVCVKILRRHINLLGYDNSFTIYDSDDSKKLITDIMKQLNIDENLLSVRTVSNNISRAKEKGQIPYEYALDMGNDTRGQKIAQVYSEHQNQLLRSNAVDFDDIIMLTNTLFETENMVLEKYRDQFDYILVDEYQDTNPSQSRLVTLLAGSKKNVCVVGDDDQSIYSFRGATVENILSFDKCFKEARTVRLEQNYRSTGNILNAANGLIKNNTGRKGKNLWTDSGDGEPILLKKHGTQSDEAFYVADTIKALVSTKQFTYNDFAVLYRMNAQSNAIETSLSKSRIPYRVFGGIRFYERKEIKDIIAYLSVISNTGDDTRLKRIINVPKRQIGPNTVLALSEIASREKRPVFDIIKESFDYPELQKSTPKLDRFYSLIAELKEFAKTATISELTKEVIVRTEYKEMLINDEEASKAENLDELVSSAVAFEESTKEPTLASFLEDIALVSDTDNFDSGADAVTLMTIHSAKGLEFPVVFIPGFEEGVFPSLQAMSEGDKGLEEERRLAYVAITRAKKKLVIMHANSRLLFGRTTANPISRFAEEIPQECLVEESFSRPVYSQPTEVKKRNSNSQESFLKNISIATSAAPQHSGIFFSEGKRVSHNIFGAGTILKAEEMGPDVLYEIEFDNGSVKKLMGTFAKLKEI